MAGVVGARAWPPIHDQSSLDAAIKRIAGGLFEQFYLPSVPDQEPCQGDILELATDVPVLDEVGEASTDGTARYWLMVANTCDATRAFKNEDGVTYAQIVPLLTPAELDFDNEMITSARACRLGRVFYVPSWDDGVGPHIADLTRFVSLHREALRDVADIRARMREDAWALLNGCLVRLLCRDDRRHVP